MISTQDRPLAVDSSLLASVDYDASQLVLQLEFRSGAIYRYFTVPATIHADLLAADSKGSYFNHRIRGNFPYTLIRRPR
jgi:hypothetical protein